MSYSIVNLAAHIPVFCERNSGTSTVSFGFETIFPTVIIGLLKALLYVYLVDENVFGAANIVIDDKTIANVVI